MKRKSRWLLLILPLALLAWAWQAASWRPKLVGVQPEVTVPWPVTETQLLIAPDGKRLVSFAMWREKTIPKRGLAVWNLESRTLAWQQKPLGIGWMKPLAFSPDSRLLAVISDWDNLGRPNRVVDVLDAATGESRCRIVSADDREIQSAAFRAPDELVISTTQGVAVMNAQTGEVIRQWKFRAVAFNTTGKSVYQPQSDISADGTTILALANGKDATLYDSATGRKTAQWTLDGIHRDPRLSPDGKLWAMSLPDIGYPSFYDARTGQQLLNNLAYGNANLFQYWGANSSQIASPTGEKLAILDARNGNVLREVPCNQSTQTLALDARGGFYYTLDDKGKVWRWRLR